MKKQKSSSSGKMEKLKDWKDVAELGKRISDDMGLNRSSKLISKWMVHRMAELMDQGEKEKNKSKREKARAACSDLILRLLETKKISELSEHLYSLSMSFSPGFSFSPPQNKTDKKSSGEFENKLSTLKDIATQENEICEVGILVSLPEKLPVSDKESEETKGLQDKINDLIKIRKSKIEGISEMILDREKISSRYPKIRQKAIKEALITLLDEKRKALEKL